MLHHDLPTEHAAMISVGRMQICPKCRTTYTSTLSEECYRDGQRLVEYYTFLENENDPLRGVTIGGKYTLAHRIGQGGMGTVYKAVQEGLRREVAVKILKRELNVDPDTVARFHREANAMSLLTHPHTVRVYDFGQTDDGLLYLVMELLTGRLITQLMNEGPLPLRPAIELTQQILRSLAEAHEKALVHRDLKPDNIFLAEVAGHEEPVVKVLDFGIAKVVTPNRRLDQFETQAGTVFGTPRYMSPEQAQGASLDHRSDLYSVGTLLYQMLTGRAPFVDDDAVVVMAKHIREQPESPSRVVPERYIPRSLEAVVVRALAKDPADRFQAAGEFDAALESCLPDVTVIPSTQTSLPVSLPPSWQRSVALVLMVGSVAAGLGVLGVRALTEDAPHSVPLASAKDLVVKKTPTVVPLRAPIVTPVAITTPTEAVVTLRSTPAGAAVRREGKKLGETPYALKVSAQEDIVRVELSLPGYVPLAAELTAKDGDRLFALSPARSDPPAPRSQKRKGARTVEATPRPEPQPAAPSPPPPAEPSSSSPYQRFD